MQITSSVEAGAFVKSLRELRGLSRQELSSSSGIPLRTVYAVEKGELNNLSVDRLIALLAALDARLDVRVTTPETAEEAETNRLVKLAATGTLDADRWGLLS
ncbi:MAG: helix-turn-helix domain-containing protein [Atopobiaceae bacterium]|nr:helix-turn-helix domain-containing protein [Atopobiaceae bacterium]